MAQEPDGQLTLFDLGNPEEAEEKKTVYTIAGNVIGRTGKNGGNQFGVGTGPAPTLTANDRHAVCVQCARFFGSSGYAHYRETDVAGPLSAGQGKLRNDTPLVV